MARTSVNIPLPSNTWVNISLESGIDFGKRIIIDNIGPDILRVSVQETQPTKDTNRYQKFFPGNLPIISQINDYPIWIYSANREGAVNVRETVNGVNPLIETKEVKEDSELFAEMKFNTSLLEALTEIRTELRLLNARIEEAFDTHINKGDVDNVHTR